MSLSLLLPRSLSRSPAAMSAAVEARRLLRAEWQVIDAVERGKMTMLMLLLVVALLGTLLMLTMTMAGLACTWPSSRGGACSQFVGQREAIPFSSCMQLLLHRREQRGGRSVQIAAVV